MVMVSALPPPPESMILCACNLSGGVRAGHGQERQGSEMRLSGKIILTIIVLEVGLPHYQLLLTP